jgi:hypothetical protein
LLLEPQRATGSSETFRSPPWGSKPRLGDPGPGVPSRCRASLRHPWLRPGAPWGLKTRTGVRVAVESQCRGQKTGNQRRPEIAKIRWCTPRTNPPPLAPELGYNHPFIFCQVDGGAAGPCTSSPSSCARP